MILQKLGITKLEIYFQPIISVKKRAVFGYEALLRAYKDGKYIAPNILFQKAVESNMALELDRYVRIRSIEKFKDYYDENNKLLLFLNFESSSISHSFQSDLYSFEKSVKELEIPPKNFVLEVKEDEIESTQSLKDFAEYYREKGFNIAIDDFGTGDSQFDRLSIVKPDIVKIDKSLLKDIATNDINAQILNAIANMCHNIGAVALCEGVEEESEILKSLNFSIDIFQGYWFAHPSGEKPDFSAIADKIDDVGYKHKSNFESIMRLKKELFIEASDISKKIISMIHDIDSFPNEKILSFLEEIKKIEALYIIDTKSSKQLNDTLFMAKQRGFHQPSVHGDDHSLKEYFYICKESKHGEFITKKYISSASGNICRTFSKKFLHNSKELIVCLDLYL